MKYKYIHTKEELDEQLVPMSRGLCEFTGPNYYIFHTVGSVNISGEDVETFVKYLDGQIFNLNEARNICYFLQTLKQVDQLDDEGELHGV